VTLASHTGISRSFSGRLYGEEREMSKLDNESRMPGRAYLGAFSGICLALGMSGAAEAQAQAACGGDVPCQLPGGQYYVHLPDGDPSGAIFFLHGFRGNALNEIRNTGFQKMADDLGVVFVAIDGIEGTWSFPGSPRDYRDEFAFFGDVVADVSQRFGVDRQKTMLSGFSSGGFMTWYTACDDADHFGGYAPIAGAFWKPLPESCPTHAPFLFHVHGTADKVVPLEGRPLGGGRWHQGNVFESFDMWRRQSDLPAEPSGTYKAGDLRCEEWQPESGLLELCLHDGGHSIRADWISRAWQRLGAARGWD